MTDPIYYRVKRFFPDKEYETFSKIFGKAEIVSYDASLMVESCTDSKEEVEDLHLLLQTPLKSDEQIIAYYKNPTISSSFHKHCMLVEGFEFCGYDLSEDCTKISAVTNCGGWFETAIPYSKLNAFGLIDEYDEAFRIRDLLAELYDDPHAYCEVYELWRKLC